MTDSAVAIDTASSPKLGTPDPVRVANDWIASLDAAFRAQDSAAVVTHFQEDGWWRDQLLFDWDLRTFHGTTAIANHLDQTLTTVGARNFVLADGYEVQLVEGPAGRVWIEGVYTLETAQARGKGIFRLTRAADEEAWKAWTLLTAMVEIKGFEQTTGVRRPVGVVHGASRGQKSWKELREEHLEYRDDDPQVVILGGGQGGLALAAQLGQLGVDALIVERNPRIGDSWRKRYKSLVLHDPVWSNHLPFMPFPETWPVFTPKDKLADWFESYVSTLDLNVWTGAEFISGEYDKVAGRWTISLRNENGEDRLLRPAHFVLATGVSGLPWSPTITDEQLFEGEVGHSSDFDGSSGYGGKSVIIVGACNSAHDIAHDLSEQGAQVTMVQRSNTHVMGSENGFAVLHAGVFGQDVMPIDDADMIAGSFPLPVVFQLHDEGATPEIARRDAELHAGLEKAGFRVNPASIQELFLTRGGGYYIEVGASRAIIDGKIGVRNGVEVDHFTKTGVVYTDGSTQNADVVVYATGYGNMTEVARLLLGDGVADQCKPVWGVDEDGEMSSVWRRSGSEGLWFMGGNLALIRPHSKLLALQIKAIEEGLAPRDLG